MSKYAKILAVLLFTWGCLPSDMAYAQSPGPAVVPAAASGPGVAPATTGPEAAKVEDIHAKFTGSLFLSALEILAIQQALSGRTSANADMLQMDENLIPLNRYIEVSGVLYRGTNDWIVWMNGQKVTPKNLLPEIVDIQVKNSSYVRLKWYDAGRKKVISVTMRPHQTYEIATDLIWPGTN